MKSERASPVETYYLPIKKSSRQIKIRNPKHEIRNKLSQIDLKPGKSKTPESEGGSFLIWCSFSDLNLFRISDFVLRIFPPWRSLRLCGKTFLSDRQCESELTAFAHFAFYPDLSPMQFDKLFSQR
jgi:hypothetical protein